MRAHRPPSDDHTEPGRTDVPDDLAAAERRAPGWRLRCRRCGFEIPYGLVGVRLAAASRGKFVLGRCRRCGHLGCMAVERRERS